MSDVSQGHGWWIASDGKWYPPDLHPSVREKQAQQQQKPHWTPPSQATVIGNDHKPDLFKKAMAGSSLADTVQVKYDADSDRTAAAVTSARRDPNAGAKKKKRWGH